MKVIKFGGTSVGSANSILSVKRIVEAVEEPVIVVVSALGHHRQADKHVENGGCR